MSDNIVIRPVKPRVHINGIVGEKLVTESINILLSGTVLTVVRVEDLHQGMADYTPAQRLQNACLAEFGSCPLN